MIKLFNNISNLVTCNKVKRYAEKIKDREDILNIKIDKVYNKLNYIVPVLSLVLVLYMITRYNWSLYLLAIFGFITLFYMYKFDKYSVQLYIIKHHK